MIFFCGCRLLKGGSLPKIIYFNQRQEKPDVLPNLLHPGTLPDACLNTAYKATDLAEVMVRLLIPFNRTHFYSEN